MRLIVGVKIEWVGYFLFSMILLSCSTKGNDDFVSRALNETLMIIKEESYPIKDTTIINPCLNHALNTLSLETYLSENYKGIEFNQINAKKCITKNDVKEFNSKNFTNVNFQKIEKTGLSSAEFARQKLKNKGYIDISSIWVSLDSQKWVVNSSYICGKHCGFEVILDFKVENGVFHLVNDLRSIF